MKNLLTNKILALIFIYIIVIFCILFFIIYRLNFVEQELYRLKPTIRETVYAEPMTHTAINKSKIYPTMPAQKIQMIEINDSLLQVDYEYEQYQKLMSQSAPKEQEWIQNNEDKFKEKLSKKQQLENQWLENHLR